jgi:hypothetical protein
MAHDRLDGRRGHRGTIAGVASGSLVLMAFGLDSVVELISAGVLMWRLSVELRDGHAFSENAERIASRIGGMLLVALAGFVVIFAGWNLWTRDTDEFSLPGFHRHAFGDSSHAVSRPQKDRACQSARQQSAES